jgi:hypothetical protein
MTAPSSQSVKAREITTTQSLLAPLTQEILALPALAMLKQVAQEHLPIPAAPVTPLRLAALRIPPRPIQNTEIKIIKEDRVVEAVEAVEAVETVETV